ncbi:protein DMP7 [Cornus florida]|uniref:protein DMP7 n=1 Tax=Cornus florida TaxID=4283 RepID=UPI00289756A4|nr:protein DMP7 [Cornus florida]
MALEEEQQPLLEDEPTQTKTAKPRKKLTVKALRKAFKGTAHLSNHLPSGSVMAFQILSPIFTNQGQCHSPQSQSKTLALLGFCGLSCFLLCLTDSFRDERGKVRYGLATFRGLWVMDGSVMAIPPEEAAKYRLRFADFFHGFMSMLVFAAVALFDQNVVKCFFPVPSEEAKDFLAKLPIGVGVVCSLLFVAFPTNRHGIGFPLSRH